MKRLCKEESYVNAIRYVYDFKRCLVMFLGLSGIKKAFLKKTFKCLILSPGVNHKTTDKVSHRDRTKALLCIHR